MSYVCPECGAPEAELEEKWTFHGDWYLQCTVCDATVDWVEPNDEPLDLKDDTDVQDPVPEPEPEEDGGSS